MKIATLSVKNQITLPAVVLQELGIESGDKLFVQAEEDKITIKPVGKNLVNSLAGSIRIGKRKRGIPFEEILSATKRVVAKKLATA